MKKMYVIQTFTRTPRIPNNTCGHVAITILINGGRQEEIIFHSDLFSQCKIFSEHESRQLKDGRSVWLEGLAGND